MSSSMVTFDSSVGAFPPLAGGTAARLGRCDAEIVSVAGDEVRLRHSGSLKVGTEITLTYLAGMTRQQVGVVVRSCRVLALGGGANGATLYETCVSAPCTEASVSEAQSA